MPERSARNRLRRLDELKGLLAAREHVTQAELAAELGISPRTLARDLELLRAEGVPIDSDRGRGGGLRLHRNWSFGRLHFTPAEAIDLLLGLAIAEGMNAPLLLGHLSSIARKMEAAFPPDQRQKIRSLRKRILLGRPASETVLASFAPPPREVLANVAEAFFEQRCARIDYVDGTGNTSRREIEPHFLHFNMPVWYLLAWDRLRGAVRFFRIDRIASVETMAETFRLADPRPFLAQAEAGVSAL